MTVPTVELKFERRAWSVPSEERAFEGTVEGRPTEAQRNATLARTRKQRAEWKPDAEALEQLVKLQQFVGRRVRIQFWSSDMIMLADDEWAHPVVGNCEGVVTLIDEGFLQPFLLLRDPTQIESGGSSGLSYLVEREGFNCKLAPVAEMDEIETVGEA